MRIKHFMLGLLSVAALASCSVQEELQPDSPRGRFRGTVEQLGTETSTRAFATYDGANKKYHILWNADDRISIFEEDTYNREYRFKGKDGAASGSFLPVDTNPSSASSLETTDYQYAIYPFREENACSPDGALSVLIPKDQEFYDDARGVGARMLMVARSEDGDFSFKHIGSYIAVTLKGNGVPVASISFQGNNGETLAGLATVTFDEKGEPVTVFNTGDPNKSNVITMQFEEPVVLSSEEKEFWLVVPSITLSSGYTMTVTDTDGGVFQKITSDSWTGKRKTFYHCRAEVETSPVPLDEHSYTKASTITAGGTYLVVDATDDQRVFKGAKDGSYVSVSPENDIITDTDGSLAAYEFTVEQSGSNYYLKFNDGNYLVCDYSNSGNTTTGIRYVATQDLVDYPYSLTIVDGVFFFSTTQINNGSTDQILYYKPINAPNSGTDRFKIGGTGSDYGVHLYMKGGKRARGLKFEPEEVICLEGNVPEKPVLSGTYTTLTWTSENTAVATVDGNGDVTIVGIGTTTITAEAEEDTYYQAGSASYTLTVLDSDTASYVKAAAITVGGTYLIVDKDDQRAFKGAKDGSYVSVAPENGVIIDYDRTLSAYEFTVEKNGNNYYLKFNDGNYLVCDYGSSGNGDTGLRYVATQSAATYPYALTVNAGVFEFSTTQMTSTSSTNQVLYYKPANASGNGTNRFKIGGSGVGVGVHLYMKGGKQDRGLKFEPESVTCLQGNTPEKPVLSGTYTTARYSSDNTSVATVDETSGTVTVKGIGMATITATVAEDEDYMAGTATYTLTVLDPTSSTYTKVTTLTIGGIYLIVDAEDKLIFKGNINGSSQSVTPVNGVITDDTDHTLAAYEFTVEQSGSNYYLKFNDGTYLISNWNSPGNGSTGLCYVNTQAEVQYPYALTTDNGAFMFSTTQVNSSTSTNQVLYYKTSESVFKIGGSGRGVGIHLYLKGGGGSSTGQQVQTLRFDPTSVTCTLDGSFTQPTLSGVKTTVSYSSSDTSVALVDKNTGAVTRRKVGTTTITATAVENEQYLSGEASYTLYIVEPPSGEWKDLGTISLENKAVSDYLTAANNQYTDTNEKTTTIVSSYVNGSQYSSISRKDCPAPVTITWTNSATSSTKVTIYQDEALTQEVWSQNATSDSKSADVYNLIPGIKYYYTVSDNGTIWEKGYFNTSGRRRMIRVSGTSSTDRANNCRDLGGMITKDGTKRIKYGYIFRGSNMNSTTSTEKDILTNYLKIKMDIDLRVSSSSPWGGSSSQYASRVFSASTYPEIGYLNRGFDGYSDLASDDGLARVGDIITTIMDTVLEGKAVYFHCYVGADRTGIIGVMLEGLLGISEKDCSIDYELTSFCTAVGLRPRDGSQNDHYFSKGLKLLRDQEGETFQDKCNAFLTSSKVGVSQTKINQFKAFILESNN